MFILTIARKYLLPKRDQLSVSLIALMSIGVISLVTWLLLVFLSIIGGIESNWIKKLTALNAPIRISPTEAYYNSYYYKVDGVSLNSDYKLKTIGEKLESELSDPFSPEFDTLPPSLASLKHVDQNNQLVDPVKSCFDILGAIQHPSGHLKFQDYEMSGAMLRLQMIRGSHLVDAHTSSSGQGVLTQVSYLASLSDQSPTLGGLILPPEEKDLNHLIFLSQLNSHNISNDKSKSATFSRENSNLEHILSQCEITQFTAPEYGWEIPQKLFPNEGQCVAEAVMQDGKVSHIWIPSKSTTDRSAFPDTLLIQNGAFKLKTPSGETFVIQRHHPIYLEGGARFDAQQVIENKLNSPSNRLSEIATNTSFSQDLETTPLNLESAEKREDSPFLFHISGKVQNMPIAGKIPLGSLTPIPRPRKEATNPPWIFAKNGKTVIPSPWNGAKPIVLPKAYRQHDTMIGDQGYISYPAATASSTQEQRLPVYVAGFYDPGVLNIGNKCILVPKELASSINATNQGVSFDRAISNGIHVWCSDAHAAPAIRDQIIAQFEKAGISKYWKVETYREYDFAQSLFEQFQSDKTLFSLVGIIILVVACCNIISLLVLLVNDKKREIGILLSLGASKRSIGAIFGICGCAMGVVSCLIGSGLAYFTLHHINGIVAFIGRLQGHTPFNPAFFGNQLPSEMSPSALLFIGVAGPIIAILAGIIPALKASRLKPSEILRSS